MKKLLFIISALIIANSSKSQTLSQGYNFSSQTTNNSASGVAWIIPTSSPYNPWVSLNIPNQFSQGVALTGFTFSIPTGATIVGVEATVGYTVTNCKDSIVKLTNGGLEFGTNKATNILIPMSFGSTDLSYGSPSDTWGSSLTPTIINSSSFGIVVCIYLSTSSSGGGGLYLSGLPGNPAKIKVYYTTATGIIENQESTTSTFSYGKTLYLNNLFNDLRKIEVYTLLGEKIYDALLNSDQKQVDLNHFNTGIYVYKITFKNGKEINKKVYLD